MDDTSTKILIGLISVLGSAIVASAVYVAGRQQAKIDLTISLYREYYSSDFGKIRHQAELFVRANYQNDWSTWNPYDADRSKDREGYSEVIRFFHRLAILELQGRLNRRLLARLFSREYGWWSGFLFDRMRQRSDWLTGEAIRKLGHRLHNFGGYSLLSEGSVAGTKSFAEIPKKRALAEQRRRAQSLQKLAQSFIKRQK